MAERAKRESDIISLEQQNKDLKDKLERKIKEYERNCEDYKERLGKLAQEEEIWKNKNSLIHSNEECIKSREKILNEMQKDINNTHKLEKTKIENLMHIIESKSKENDEKDKQFKSATLNMESQILATREKERLLNIEKENI